MKWLKISLICIIVGIAILSLFPREIGGTDLPINDKIGHGIAYCTLMVNWGWTIKKKQWLTVACLSFLYSVSLEGLQYFVPGRSVDANDLLANFIGILIGIAVLKIFPVFPLRKSNA